MIQSEAKTKLLSTDCWTFKRPTISKISHCNLILLHSATGEHQTPAKWLNGMAIVINPNNSSFYQIWRTFSSTGSVADCRVESISHLDKGRALVDYDLAQLLGARGGVLIHGSRLNVQNQFASPRSELGNQPG